MRQEGGEVVVLEYLLLLLLIVGVPAVLSRDPNLDLVRYPVQLVGSVATVSLLFWVWDVVAASRGHWFWNPAYVLGITILGLPLEEWLFFPVISFVSIFTWESVRYFLKRR